MRAFMSIVSVSHISLMSRVQPSIGWLSQVQISYRQGAFQPSIKHCDGASARLAQLHM